MNKKFNSHPRIMEALCTQPWLCTEEGLRQMIAIASYEGDVEALKTKLEAKYEDGMTATVREDVAIVPLEGPIFPKANLMTEMSGATALSKFAVDFQAADEDPSINTILINANSPGGVASGIHEMANVVKNSKTKTVAYVGNQAASAAYWIVSAADEIVIDATAALGSIGVVAGISKKDEDAPLEFTNTASPKKRMDVETKEGKADLISTLDKLATVFIESVATNRQVSVKTVEKDFGQGGVLIGKEAVEAGMADRLGSYEELLQELVGTNQTQDGGSIMDFKALTKDQLVAGRPDLVTELVNQGKVEASGESKKAIEAKDGEIAAKEKENKELEAQIGELTAKNAELDRKVTAFEEKAIKASAESILTKALSDSSIPERLHGKVSAQVRKEDYISAEGKFDSDAYSAKVDAEVKDWEETLAESGSLVQGVGANSKTPEGKTGSASSDEDAILARMCGDVDSE